MADEFELLKLLERWRAEAEKVGHKITRIAVAFEAGRDGFWLARYLRSRAIETQVIHSASVAVSRDSSGSHLTDQLELVEGTAYDPTYSPERRRVPEQSSVGGRLAVPISS